MDIFRLLRSSGEAMRKREAAPFGTASANPCPIYNCWQKKFISRLSMLSAGVLSAGLRQMCSTTGKEITIFRDPES